MINERIRVGKLTVELSNNPLQNEYLTRPIINYKQLLSSYSYSGIIIMLFVVVCVPWILYEQQRLVL